MRISEKASRRMHSMKNERMFGYSRFLIVLINLAWFASLGYFVLRLANLPTAYGAFIALPFLAFALALWIGARYINRLYSLNNLSDAYKYLMASLFGMMYPTLTIGSVPIESLETLELQPDQEQDNDLEVELIGAAQHDSHEDEEDKDADNLLNKIGGPGKLKILDGHAVVVESLFNKVFVYGEGEYFLSHQEWIKEDVSLEVQEDLIPTVQSTSSDGIAVELSDVRYRYRIYSQKPHSLDDPYPFDQDAVLNSVYGRAISKHKVTSWADMVKLVVRGTITDYINRRRFDQLTAPGVHYSDPPRDFAEREQIPADPRREVVDEMNKPDVQRRLRALGAEVTWFDIGAFSGPNPVVSVQRVRNWQSKSDSASLTRSDAESQRISMQERGRAEAQADLLESIISALQDIDMQGDARQNVRNLIFLRTAQILDALGERHVNHDSTSTGD